MNKKLARDLNILAKKLIASLTEFDEWNKFKTLIQDEFPNADFKTRDEKNGDAFWEYTIFLDGRTFAYLIKKGRDKKEYKLTIMDGFDISSIDYQDYITFDEMKKAFETWKIKNPNIVKKLSKQSLEPEKIKELLSAIQKALTIVQPLFKIDTIIKKMDESFKESRGLYSIFEKDDTETTLGLFTIRYNVKNNEYTMYAKGNSSITGYSDVDQFIKELGDVKSFVENALKKLPVAQFQYIKGELKADNIIKRILDVSALFKRMDEWYETEIHIKLQLNTDSEIPSNLIAKWVKENWHKLMAKITDKSYDDMYIDPKRTEFDKNEIAGWDQSGKTGDFMVHFSTR